MKKLLAIILVMSMLFAMTACGAGDGSDATANDAGTDSTNDAATDETDTSAGDETSASGELKSFKLGMMDPLAWNATSGPLYAQMELAAKALNAEIVYATFDANSAEGHIGAIQNMISSGCDAIILLNGPLIHGIIPQVAKMCDDAGVYWSLSWTKLLEDDPAYEAAMNSEYFVSTTYEDDVYSAYWVSSILGNNESKNLAEIGFDPGNATGDMRDEGIKKACDEFGMKILAEERDRAVTTSADGGKTIMDRFIAGYPEMDGIVIAGMSQYVLSGVVSAIEENSLQDDVSVACIDFHEFQTEYLESGILDGIIGGHVVGTFYSLILVANKINGTPLTEEKMLIKDNFIEITSYDDAVIWDEYGKPGRIYTEEEILNMMVVNNPDYSLDEFNKMVENYSLDDIVARNSK